eukprot:365323-Chlamydomonas_euryale.AAC.19
MRYMRQRQGSARVTVSVAAAKCSWRDSRLATQLAQARFQTGYTVGPAGQLYHRATRHNHCATCTCLAACRPHAWLRANLGLAAHHFHA